MSGWKCEPEAGEHQLQFNTGGSPITINIHIHGADSAQLTGPQPDTGGGADPDEGGRILDDSASYVAIPFATTGAHPHEMQHLWQSHYRAAGKRFHLWTYSHTFSTTTQYRGFGVVEGFDGQKETAISLGIWGSKQRTYAVEPITEWPVKIAPPEVQFTSSGLRVQATVSAPGYAGKKLLLVAVPFEVDGPVTLVGYQQQGLAVPFDATASTISLDETISRAKKDRQYGVFVAYSPSLERQYFRPEVLSACHVVKA